MSCCCTCVCSMRAAYACVVHSSPAWYFCYCCSMSDIAPRLCRLPLHNLRYVLLLQKPLYMGVVRTAVCAGMLCSPYALHALLMVGVLQLELGRNRCRDKRMEVWPRAVDTTLFNPAFRCESMRQRMTDGHPDATILVYVGRLGAGLQLTLTSPLLLQVIAFYIV